MDIECEKSTETENENFLGNEDECIISQEIGQKVEKTSRGQIIESL